MPRRDDDDATTAARNRVESGAYVVVARTGTT
jgi:hypothetical protein